MIFSVHELNEQDVAEYKKLRLAALQEDAWAFDEAAAAEHTFTDESWAKVLHGRRSFVGSADNVPVALAEVTNTNGQLYLQSVWVAAEARGTPLTDLLLSTVIRQTHGDLALWVGENNSRAHAVYLRHGFVDQPSDEFPGWVFMVRRPG